MLYRKSGKALIILIPGGNTFGAVVVIGSTIAEKAFALELTERTRAILENAHQYHDGRWLLIQVTSKENIDDLIKLMRLKARPAKKHT